MPKFITLRQRSPEWFAWRKNKITASLTPTIMGLNPHKTPLMLYNQLLEGKEEPANEYMQYGIDQEANARDWLFDKIGIEYKEACAVHDDFEWLAASLDGWQSPNYACEIKCMQPKNHEKVALVGCLPEHYPQLQHQLCVLDIDWMYYLAYRHDMEPHLVEVKRDNKFIEKMLPMLQDFRHRLISFMPPDPTDKDLDLLESKTALEACKTILHSNEVIKQHEALIEGAKEVLKNESNGRSCKIGDSRFVKYSRKGNIDIKKIVDDFAISVEELEEYRKPNFEQWRFS